MGKRTPRQRGSPSYVYEDKSFDRDRRRDDLSFWLDLLNDHLEETDHELGFEEGMGAYCRTCAEEAK